MRAVQHAAFQQQRLASFLQAGLVDELVLYIAPKLLGSDGWPLAELPFTRLAEAIDLRLADVRAVGDDWRITAEPRRHRA